MTKKTDEIISESKDGSIVFNKEALKTMISGLISEELKTINDKIDSIPNMDRIEKKLDDAVDKKTLSDTMANSELAATVASNSTDIESIKEFMTSVGVANGETLTALNNVINEVNVIRSSQIDEQTISDVKKIVLLLRELGVNPDDVDAEQIREIAKKFGPMMQMGMMMGGGMPGMPPIGKGDATQPIDNTISVNAASPKKAKIYSGKQCQICGAPFDYKEWEKFGQPYEGRDGNNKMKCPVCKSENNIYRHTECGGLFLSHLGLDKIRGTNCPLCGEKLAKPSRR